MLEGLQAIDEIRLNFSPTGLFILNLTISFIMFGVALELKPEQFKRLLKNPKPAIIGGISQFMLMPLMTFLLAIALRNYITPTIGLGMISNFFSSLAKGNVALSVSLTAISDLGAIFITPFNFAFWGNLFTKVYSLTNASDLVKPLVIDPIDMFKTVFILLGVPLALGILYNMKFPKLTSKIIVPIKRFSLFTFAAIVVILFANNFDYFIKYIKYIFLIVLVHNAIALSMGYSFASLFKLPFKDRKTISIETGIQNSGLALVLMFNPKIFPPNLAIGGMLFIAAWWGIWHLIAGFTVAGFWSGFSLRPKKETTKITST